MMRGKTLWQKMMLLTSLVAIALGAAGSACPGDGSDDDDDDTYTPPPGDDDDADDDAAGCSVSDVCAYLVEDCGGEGTYGSTTDCASSFAASCGVDPNGYVECACACSDADSGCADAETAFSCVTDCYLENCY